MRQHALHLRQSGAHVDAGDVGKLAHEGIVKTRLAGRAPGGHPGVGHVIGQFAHGQEHEEIGAQRSPVHLAQRTHAHFVRGASKVKAQRVAQADAQRCGQALFHAGRARFFGLPAASGQAVVGGQRGGVGEVEFALGQALRALVAETGGSDGERGSAGRFCIFGIWQSAGVAGRGGRGDIQSPPTGAAAPFTAGSADKNASRECADKTPAFG